MADFPAIAVARSSTTSGRWASARVDSDLYQKSVVISSKAALKDISLTYQRVDQGRPAGALLARTRKAFRFWGL
jgi:hypothetical protein